jgi:molybdopterin/thiamine biosynthesis adenylyltransferase
MDRLDRNIRFFGADGQERLRRLRIAIVGIGGLGTHVTQQLAYLGIGEIVLIDDEDLDETNKNRYVSAYFRDPVPGSRKVDLAERMVLLIDPHISIIKIYRPLCSKEAFREIVKADYVFGCVDNDGARLVLTELCAAYSLPYFDLATEIIDGPPLLYGGRVCTAWKGDGCPVCLDQLDLREAQRDLETDGARQDRVKLYGLTKEETGAIGPSVVSVNGVIASLGVTEFMAAATDIRAPNRLLTYRGDLGRVTVSTDKSRSDCYYCKEVYGLREAVEVQRYTT